ncbi:diaminopropionate ammonia-lyase [Pyramidobacter piscolens]|uniref:diaminopropionate ammonia-lyase n=1 Tax=Pyramidobacter piscolens TaxID=638849 RepID=UPI001FCB1924|nr:diaminopropionate ammonia-lyase [Pyramidobacter piscolens]BDF77349.1 diaminopropionate ammonia-lyase [Pyramidobacter piscolens]
MEERFKAIHYERDAGVGPAAMEQFGPAQAEKVRAFHRSFPEYAPTPLADLPHLARELGVAALRVKDESHRFGLNAFKVLGGSYCLGRCVAERLGLDPDSLTFAELTSPEVLAKIDGTTFVTATDGNHGRGVAWTAAKLKQRCVVYMPKGSAAERLENIRRTGADASITEFNYNDTVALARDTAAKNGWTLVQDTSWPGYEEIPLRIMQGYLTMTLETAEQLGGKKPTHVFLQAGVGSMPAAAAAFFANLYGAERPIVTIVESNQADCIYRTAAARDGKIHAVNGDMRTIMAGLACGVPGMTAWELLRRCADNFVSMPDYPAAQGMRILGAPLPGDPRVISGESGASAFGLVTEVLRSPGLKWLKEQLRLDENSHVLCFSTEGATDRANYRRIVWDGAFARDRSVS